MPAHEYPEQLGRQVLRGADVGRAEVELARIRLGELDQVGQRLELAAFIGDDDEIERGQRRDQGEGFERIERQRLEQRLAHRRAAGNQQQRCGRPGAALAAIFHGDDAAGARLFSITTGWPSVLAMCSPRTRAVMSAAPPGTW